MTRPQQSPPPAPDTAPDTGPDAEPAAEPEGAESGREASSAAPTAPGRAGTETIDPDTEVVEFATPVHEALYRGIASKRAAGLRIIGLYALAAALLGAGMLVRSTAGPAWAAGAALVVGKLMTPQILRLVTLKVRPIKKVRTLAPRATYERRRRAAPQLPPQAAAVIDNARALASARFGTDVPVYITEPDAPPLMRIGAVVCLSPPMIIVGDRLLGTVDQLRWVLAHELQHTTRLQRRIHLLWGMAMTAGWMLLGLLLAPAALWVAVPVLAAALIGVAWARELTADTAAAGTAGDGAAAWHAAVLDTMRRAPWYLRIVRTSPIHPPVRMRACLTSRIVDRRTR
ncbi:hypothetical protein [Actinomadura violacea]|uniref:Peptidase M48 domain-containing protein n=1 Tax=Actinomadura violacea TaxID=2819934 RepID=A0ABS3RXU1_9ACTN|nr:hypothetical protein [Actinomadura violacea]MBO2461522.1 hypothetical protein [Actinomadura violacea]